jgi:hypothetical protein
MAAALAVLLAGGTLYLLTLIRRLGAVLDQAPPRPDDQARTSACPPGCACRGQTSQ